MSRRSGGARRKQWWCRILWTFSNFSSCWILCNLFCFICTIESVGGLHTLSPRVVFTKQGPVQGFLGPGIGRPHMSTSTFNFRNFGGLPVVEIFKGIPFANPPVVALRYESPAPLTPRSKQDVYSANVTKPPCPRHRADVLFNRTNYPENPYKELRKIMDLDDCLYLDIYAPLNTEKNRGQGVAVLVYVNSQQDDPEDPFDGSSMAAIGNVIVISFRYRVGVLGFLQPGFSEDVRSNFGLWDQLAALQWIKVNIEEFGGDPNNICLMGYDMDATLAGLLALSPVSQAYNGLFHRLILLNGSPFAPNSINLKPLETTFQLARTLKCPLDDRAGGLMTCLRRASTPQLITAAESVGTPLLSYPFAPTVDGTIVREEINQNGHGQANKEMLGKYDLLCGLQYGNALPRIGRPSLANIDLDSFVTAIIKMIMKMETGSEPTERVKKEVKDSIISQYGFSPDMGELVSEFLMVQPMLDLLNTHSQTGRNTFFYVFKDYDPLRKRKHNEISYIFSSSVYRWKYIESPQMYDLQSFQLLISLLSNFVRTGDPNTADPSDRFDNPADFTNRQEPSQWMKYTPESGRYLEISQGVQFRSGYHQKSSDFWANVVPSIIHPFSKSQNQSSDYGSFPPHNTYHTNRFNGNNNPPRQDNPYPHHNNNHIVHILNPNPIPSDEEESTSISGITQSTVVLIGCLLLLLNFLCFMGLFYQRERLKKAEIQLRKRYMQTQKTMEETSNSHEMDDSSFYNREIDVNNHEVDRFNHPSPSNPSATNMQIQQMRDAMSETETENGFGPDFLGPNYDPRTKVNRWMNMQNKIKQESFERPSPSPPVDYIISKQPDIDPSIPITPMIMTPGNSMAPPINIRVSSLQRNFLPPKAQPEQPVQFLPPFPYQEPFQPNHLLVSDIPYADSRATSPSIISAPATFSNNRVPDQRVNNHSPFSTQPHVNSHHIMDYPGTVPNHTIIIPSLGSDSIGSKSPPPSTSPNPTNRTLNQQGNKNPAPKRASVLIVRDLDPVDNEMENSGPKFVPVKTGTLKRSVGVDTAHDNSAPRDIENLPPVQKVTFSDGL